MTTRPTAERVRIDAATPGPSPEPQRDCARCARLVAYRERLAATRPDWFNGAVPSFGDPDAVLLVIGLAPGRSGANRTGRPFTGDFAGGLLYEALARHGWAEGAYAGAAGDALHLTGAMVTNAMRCVPPGNRPLADEIAACRPFLASRIAALPRLSALLALGHVAHDATLKALGHRASAHPFAHGARHPLGRLTLFDSYHSSRLNVNTGRLTPAMLDAVIGAIPRHAA